MVKVDTHTHSAWTLIDSIAEPTSLNEEDALDATVSSLERSVSQKWKQVRVEEVLLRLKDHQQPLIHLKETISQLAERITQDGACLQDEKKALEAYRKSARNLGEDVLDDTLALDKLTGLFSDDRISRKAAIAALDALLEEVDQVKLKVEILAKNVDAQLVLQNEARQNPSEDSTASESPSEDPMEIDSPDDEFVNLCGADEEFHESGGMASPDSLERSGSQVCKQIQVQDVLSRLEKQKEPTQRFKEKVSRLASRVSRDNSDLDGERKVLEDCQKLGRNLGEDLLEDIVALDQLSGLFPEDRINRKSAIAGLESVLEEVDKTKSFLVTLKKDLDSRLESQNVLSSTTAAAHSNSKNHVLRLRGTPVMKSNKQPSAHPSTQCHKCHGCLDFKPEEAGSDYAGQWFCTGCCQSSEASKRQAQSVQANPSTQLQAPVVPVPPDRFWEQLDLPLQFKSFQERGCYKVSSCPCDLRPHEVCLKISRDQSCLTVSGTHLPTAAEVEAMQEDIVQHLLQRGNTSFDLELLPKLYVRASGGLFGKFSKTFQLPRDVDVTCISATCDEGVLCVKMPKRICRARPGLSHPFFW